MYQTYHPSLFYHTWPTSPIYGTSLTLEGVGVLRSWPRCQVTFETWLHGLEGVWWLHLFRFKGTWVGQRAYTVENIETLRILKKKPSNPLLSLLMYTHYQNVHVLCTSLYPGCPKQRRVWPSFCQAPCLLKSQDLNMAGVMLAVSQPLLCVHAFPFCFLVYQLNSEYFNAVKLHWTKGDFKIQNVKLARQ